MRTLRFCGLVLFLVVLMAGTTHAQQMDVLMKIDVPFEFIAGGKTLPAGTYEVMGSSLHNFIWLRNRTADRMAIERTIPVQGKTTARRSTLVFNRYGNTHFLSRVAIYGNETGRQLIRSRLERELSLQTAKAGQPPVQLVEILTK